MSEVRINFLNWNPDSEDNANEGLTVAQNLVHEPEGYKPIHLASSGAFSTTIAATVKSIVCKQVGAQNDVLCAWIANDTLNIGLNGVTMTSPTTGYPLSFGTVASTAEITVFDVAEYAGKVSFVVEAQGTHAVPATTATLRHSGYLDY